jgi:hypothetical protein
LFGPAHDGVFNLSTVFLIEDQVGLVRVQVDDTAFIQVRSGMLDIVQYRIEPDLESSQW